MYGNSSGGVRGGGGGGGGETFPISARSHTHTTFPQKYEIEIQCTSCVGVARRIAFPARV